MLILASPHGAPQTEQHSTWRFSGRHVHRVLISISGCVCQVTLCRKPKPGNKRPDALLMIRSMIDAECLHTLRSVTKDIIG